MADTTDLKSVDLKSRKGSSPFSGTNIEAIMDIDYPDREDEPDDLEVYNQNEADDYKNEGDEVEEREDDDDGS